MKKIALLGATGSIGTQTLDVLRTVLPEMQVTVLTGFKNIIKLAALTEEFKPSVVCVPDTEAAREFREICRVKCEVLIGAEGLLACASDSQADLVVNALVGRAGLAPTIAAIEAGKDLALANKETLVTAGEWVMEAARRKGCRITPIDSEHSAILQCLQGNAGNPVEKIILTASGGPFRLWPREKIENAIADDALKHPNWQMGAKITIDCATMMNKGLEVIEALWLFGLELEQIEVLIHPQSVIHSMVAFADGAVMAQLGEPDMRVPILYALTEPRRVSAPFKRIDFITRNTLTFEAPDFERFPCLALALQAAKTGGTLPAVMNYINELAVERYLNHQIGFYEIARLIADAFSSYTVKQIKSFEDIQEAEDWSADFFAQRFPLV